METEMILRVAAVGIAAFLLVSSFDISVYWNSIKKWFAKKPKPIVVPLEDDEEDVVADKPFLEIVDLWYSLREKCTGEGLDQAVEKLDEVFPLFNAENEDV
jgi:hypothetical protein